MPVMKAAMGLLAMCMATTVACAAPAFDDAVQAGEHMPRLYSLLASQHGELILEHYFHGARAAGYANLKSASKSVISALVTASAKCLALTPAACSRRDSNSALVNGRPSRTPFVRRGRVKADSRTLPR